MHVLTLISVTSPIANISGYATNCKVFETLTYCAASSVSPPRLEAMNFEFGWGPLASSYDSRRQSTPRHKAEASGTYNQICINRSAPAGFDRRERGGGNIIYVIVKHEIDVAICDGILQRSAEAVGVGGVE